jgi:GNAT superfamily N-acetyltransferase
MNNVIPLPRLEVRPGNPADRGAVAAMVETVWREIYSGRLPAESMADRGEGWFSELVGDPGDQGWVAMLGDQVVGFSRVMANCVDQLWVPGRMRRRGIGTALLGEAVAAIRARGFAFAQAGCEDFNPGGLRFLEANGWRVIDSVSQPLGRNRSCQALVFSRSLR